MVAMDRCKLSLDLPKVIIAPPTDTSWWVEKTGALEYNTRTALSIIGGCQYKMTLLGGFYVTLCGQLWMDSHGFSLFISSIFINGQPLRV